MKLTLRSYNDSARSGVGPSNLCRKVFLSPDTGETRNSVAEIGVSSLPDEAENLTAEATICVEAKAEPEDLFYDPEVARRELKLLVRERSFKPMPKKRKPKRKRPHPPGFTLSSLETLEALRHRFGISEEV